MMALGIVPGGPSMRRTCLVLIALALAGSASAETLRVESLYPAGSDQAAAVRSIQVEPFGGEFGEDLTVQVEDALRGIDLGKGAWLRVIPAMTGSGGEALLRGTANTEQRFSDYTEEHERCIKDGAGKCTETKEKITVKCRRRHVELIVALRLIARDGTLLWSDNRPEVLDDQSSPRQRSSIARELAGRVARRVRFDFAPHAEAEDIRVDEGRKGLSKPDSDAFKAAVRLANNRKAPAACDSWRKLGQANPGHVPTQFNIGLCAESGGDDAVAAAQYRRILTLNPKYSAAQRGLERIAERDHARRQTQAHEAE
jgi:hypothetical protein